MREIFIEYCHFLQISNTKFCEQEEFFIFPDISPIEELKKNCSLDVDLQSFLVRPFRIALPYVSSHTIPSTTRNIELVFDAEVEISKSTNTKYICDPLGKLTFNIVLRGDGDETMASWHLDKHSQVSSLKDGESKLLHPEYHFSFGGKYMEEKYNYHNWDFGQTLIMRSPRLMHPPMDIILGIDFILNQFIPRKYSGFFLDNPQYTEIIYKMKEFLWKPYAYAFAKNFFTNWSDNKNLYYDLSFCKSIIG